MATKASMLALVKDTVDFYKADTSRRSVAAGGACLYKTDDGRSCAVGRHMSMDEYEELDSKFGSMFYWDTPSEQELQFINPDSPLLKYPVPLLGDLQTLHDNDKHWNVEGITYAGRKYTALLRQRVRDGWYK